MRKLRLNPLGGVKRRLNGVNEGLHALQRLTSTSHAIQACVKNEEHKDLLFAMLQMGLWVSVDSRKSCIENTKKYLNAVRPAKLDNLVRIGGKMDGGYVMLPPPPIVKLTTKGSLSRRFRLFPLGFRNGKYGLSGIAI